MIAFIGVSSLTLPNSTVCPGPVMSGASPPEDTMLVSICPHAQSESNTPWPIAVTRRTVFFTLSVQITENVDIYCWHQPDLKALVLSESDLEL